MILNIFVPHALINNKTAPDYRISPQNTLFNHSQAATPHIFCGM